LAQLAQGPEVRKWTLISRASLDWAVVAVGFGWAQNQPVAHLTFEHHAQNSLALLVFDARPGGSRSGIE
jgi:hypothetical protein